MQIFINELRRVYSIKRIMIIVCLVVASCMFYMNEQKDNIVYTEYAKIMESGDYYNVNWEEFSAGTEQYVQERIKYAQNYNNKIAEIIKKAQENLGISIFAKKGSFSYNNQLRVQEDFARVENIELIPVNDCATETFISYNYLVFFMLAAMYVVIEAMNFNDRKSLGMLIYSAPYGRRQLGVARAAVIISSALLISGLFIVCNLVVAFGMYGGVEVLMSPIQSMMRFEKCTSCITVAQGIMVYGMYTACGLSVAGLLLWLLLGVFRDIVLSVAGIVFFIAIEGILFYIPSQSVFVVLKYANIFSLIMSRSWMSSYINVNVINNAIPVQVVVISYIVTVLIVCLIGGIYVSGQKVIATENILSKFADKIRQLWQKVISHIQVGLIDVYSIMTKHKGLLLLAIAVVILMNNSRIGAAQYTTVSVIKCGMYEELEGKSNEEIRLYIEQIKDSLETLVNQQNEAIEGYKAGTGSIENVMYYNACVADFYNKVSAVTDIENQLNRLEALYNEKAIEGKLVNEEAFSYLMGEEAWETESINLMCIYLVVILLGAAFFAYEDEKNVRTIIITTKNGRVCYYIKKLIILGIICLFACLMEIVIFGNNVIDKYGFDNGNACIQSLGWLTDYPLKLNINTYIVAAYVYRGMMMVSVVLIIAGCTVMYGRFISIAIGVILLMPHLLSLLGIEVMEHFSIIKYMQYTSMQGGVAELSLSAGVLLGMLVTGIILAVKGYKNWKLLK